MLSRIDQIVNQKVQDQVVREIVNRVLDGTETTGLYTKLIEFMSDEIKKRAENSEVKGHNNDSNGHRFSSIGEKSGNSKGCGL